MWCGTSAKWELAFPEKIPSNCPLSMVVMSMIREKKLKGSRVKGEEAGV